MKQDQPDPDKVICPNCVHEFRAIPCNVQYKISALEEALEAALRPEKVE